MLLSKTIGASGHFGTLNGSRSLKVQSFNYCRFGSQTNHFCFDLMQAESNTRSAGRLGELGALGLQSFYAEVFIDGA
jgi:hypothetical protein